MDLQHIRAFVAIAREGNLTRAAQCLHLTQPAVSLQIKGLEESLKVALFDRTSRGLKISAGGAVLLPLAEKILASIGEFEGRAGHMQSDVSGRLTMGTVLTPETIRLGQALQHLVERYPRVQTVLRHGMSGWVLSQVRSGALDAGYYLGPRNDEVDADDILALRLTSFTYYVMAPKGWRDRVKGKGWAEIAALPWIWTPPHSTHHRMLVRKFSQAGVKPNIVAEVDLEASMLGLAKSGVGLTLARDSVALKTAQTEGTVVVRKLTTSADLSFITQAHRAEDGPVKAAFAAVRSAFA